MTSRERVRTSFDHKQTDQVACDFGGFCCSTMNALVIGDLRKYYGLPDEPVKIRDMSTMTGLIDEELRDILGSDVQALDSRYDTFGHTCDNWKEWTYHGRTVLIPGDCTVKEDGNGGWYVYPFGDDSVPPSGHLPAGGFYFDNIMRAEPFDEDNANPEDNCEECQIITDEEIAYYKGLAEKYKPSGKALLISPGYYALGDAANIPGPNIRHPKGIRDLTEWYTAPLLYEDYVHAVFAEEVRRAIASFEKIYAAMGNDIDIFYLCGTDFGTQRGPFINPDVFDEFYKPYYKQMNDWIHQHTTWKTLKHSCGSIVKILPGLIEAGFDAVNPVQCSAAGMDPRFLKDTFGDRIVFYGGGIDTQKVLPFGTPQEVYDQTLERCEIFSRNGGYIFNAIHIIQANTPVENVVSMLNAVKDFNAR